MPEELVNMRRKQGFHFDSSNLQDSCSIFIWDGIAFWSYWPRFLLSLNLLLVSNEFINAINQTGFQFDS